MSSLHQPQLQIPDNNQSEIEMSPTDIAPIQKDRLFIKQNQKTKTQKAMYLLKQYLYSKRTKNILMTLLYISVFLTLFLLVTLWSPASELIYNIMNSILELKAWGYILIVLLGIFILMIGVPISFFEIFIGFPLKEFWLPFVLMVVVTILGGSISFFFVKYVFRERFIRAFSKNKYYKVMEILLSNNNKSKIEVPEIDSSLSVKLDESTDNNQIALNGRQRKNSKVQKIIKELVNLKHLFLLFCLALPQFILNYGIPLFEVKYWQYILAGLPYQLFYGAIMIYVGQSASDISQLLNGSNPIKTYLFVGSCILTLIILSYLYYFTRKTLRKLNQQQQQQKQQQEQQKQQDETNQNQQVSQEQQGNNIDNLHIEQKEENNQIPSNQQKNEDQQNNDDNVIKIQNEAFDQSMNLQEELLK